MHPRQQLPLDFLAWLLLSREDYELPVEPFGVMLALFNVLLEHQGVLLVRTDPVLQQACGPRTA